MNKFASELNLYHLLSTYRVHYMKNTFTTPSAQQFGLWFQVLTSWKKLHEAGYRGCEHIRQRKKPGNIQCATVSDRVENITYDKTEIITFKWVLRWPMLIWKRKKIYVYLCLHQDKYFLEDFLYYSNFSSLHCSYQDSDYKYIMTHNY